jgi:hypothetical protein
MRARWLLAVVVVAVVVVPRDANAQGGSIGTHVGGAPAGRPAGGRPTPRPSGPTSASTNRRPPAGVTIIPGFPGTRGHRPNYFRSSIFGLVVFDPYWWVAPDLGDETAMPPLPPPPPFASPRPMGGLQLDVEPRRALVYVDGILVGTVDQYKGYFQHLETTAGYHVLEFLSPDYDPLITEVTVVPNKTTTYRGFLNRASGR